ncbi:nuclear transport factor 2 family protein [Massilia sp. PAMC28688]|uniref:YybH family protein n=1 Tax=Massilia sp. PAMC28688 TaxID=2861283 RepID=UPI001C625D15|nr:nuclear transport factor 2 family protein [Massilia sp. PAMC28688]QYF94155.1 nuclear transport factor 2 family protein [Massilia sp. PAMC28688]
MRTLVQSLFLATAISLSPLASAADPAFVGKYISTPEDTAAINKVITDFQTALKTGDAHLLSSLMISSDILFANPARPQAIKNVQAKADANFNGINPAGYPQFASMIAREKKGTIEERFYNVRITQDDNTAVVMFDFDFRFDGKIENHGLETWQMMKNKDGQWKIASVFWSSKGEPK